MHKLIASLMLALSAAALVSNEAARAVPSVSNPAPVRLTAQASFAGEAWHREDPATPGAHFDLALSDGVRVSYRLAELGETTARIEAIVARKGVTLSEPDIEMFLGTPATIEVGPPALRVEFRIDANPRSE